jgi:hypothetical protein
MSDIDLAGIRGRQDRGLAYWESVQLDWSSSWPGIGEARAAYLGVIRDIPALLEQLERVTAQRDEAWKQLDLGGGDHG